MCAVKCYILPISGLLEDLKRTALLQFFGLALLKFERGGKTSGTWDES